MAVSFTQSVYPIRLSRKKYKAYQKEEHKRCIEVRQNKLEAQFKHSRDALCRGKAMFKGFKVGRNMGSLRNRRKADEAAVRSQGKNSVKNTAEINMVQIMS